MKIWLLPVLLILILITSSCARKDNSGEQNGLIRFTANGEEFVRRGFVDKQGWHLSFQALYINLVNPTAYHPQGQVVLEGAYWVDLTKAPDQGPIQVGTAKVKPANYQSLRFSIRRAAAGPYPGYSIVLIGVAERGKERLPFTILFDEEMDFDGREGYVGDEVKGLLTPGGSTEVEMTFHFDHLFGVYQEQEDEINTGAVGFDFFAGFAHNGTVRVEQADMVQTEGYATLLRALWSLGHLGEGHCQVSGQSSDL